MQKQYERLMRRCIALAKKSAGRTSPNPLVGAVIFDDDFNIIAEGRHEYYGGNHAERNAVFSTDVNLRGKSIIVNLEPCSHHGKTPPCADLLVEKGFKRVVFGLVDPNPIVAGRGQKILEKAGIEVVVGILEDECKEVNRIFLKNQLAKLPYVTIKTATTMDGKIATSTGNSKWITDEVSRKEVQKLRNTYDCILTSSQTVIKDNPSMTCRMKAGRNPVRVILDTNLRTPFDSKVYNDDGTKVFIMTSEKVSEKKMINYPKHVEIIKCKVKNKYVDIEDVLKKLFDKRIMSILVEAGGKLNGAFIKQGLVDELVHFIAPKVLADETGVSFARGISRKNISECNDLQIISTKKLKNDIMVIAKFVK